MNLEVCNMGQPIVTLIVFNRPHSEWIFGNNIGRLRFASKQTVNYWIHFRLKTFIIGFYRTHWHARCTLIISHIHLARKQVHLARKQNHCYDRSLLIVDSNRCTNSIMFSFRLGGSYIVYAICQSESAVAWENMSPHATCLLCWQLVMICDYFKVQRILSSKTIRDGMLLNRYNSPRYLTIQQS